jgi:hypothetical protein
MNDEETCSIPKTEIDGGSVHCNHICTEVIKHSWNIILARGEEMVNLQKRISALLEKGLSYIDTETVTKKKR